MRDFSNATPREILRHIIRDSVYPDFARKGHYVILGKPGPTGKTWLTTELLKRGYDAVEISEEVFDKIGYNDDKNHVLTNAIFGTVVIILNKPYDNQTNVEMAYDILSNAFDDSECEMRKVYAAAHAAVKYLKEEIERRGR